MNGAQRQALIDLLAPHCGWPGPDPLRARVLIDGPLAPVIEALAVAQRSANLNHSPVAQYRLRRALVVLDPAWLGAPPDDDVPVLTDPDEPGGPIL